VIMHRPLKFVHFLPRRRHVVSRWCSQSVHDSSPVHRKWKLEAAWLTRVCSMFHTTPHVWLFVIPSTCSVPIGYSSIASQKT
jgi:hypothetical protein